MATARKCDRCGCFYEEYNTRNDAKNTNGIMMLNIDMRRKYFSHDIKDLCPRCMEFLVQWLGGEQDGHCEAEISN